MLFLKQISLLKLSLNRFIYNNKPYFKLNDLDKDFIIICGYHAVRNVWRSRYMLSAWAYSTNHKRISINYLWFVLFAGVVGMVLATIIRLEMAYPGIGILAGDNSQYLSIVTAHGVIMVFFMAMPLLFGFLGNFLLPTQMGVHDVAFPRMNSAAFWFLPASLLALCQLVCVDRRYQRMNCFNIKELQSLLKNRFFSDITPQILLNKDSISHSTKLKYLLNNNINDVNYFYDTKAFSFNMFFNPTNTNYSNIGYNDADKSFYTIKSFFIHTNSNYFFITSNYINSYKLIFNLNNINLLIIDVMKTFLHNVTSLSFLTNLRNLNFSMFSDFKEFTSPVTNQTAFNYNNFNYTTLYNSSNLVNWLMTTDRYNTQLTPNLIYKIKIGNYLPTDLYQINYNFLFNSITTKSVLGATADWFSQDFVSNLVISSKTTDNGILKNIPDFFDTKLNPNVTNLKIKSNMFENNKFSSLQFFINNKYNFIANSGIYNQLFNDVNLHSNLLKVSNLFASQSKQYRVLNDWRSLQIQREGWRCRMLSARHQRSLYNRYVNENELIWVVEKNAKDLLPGWAMITPFSSRTRYTLIGKTDIGIAIVAVTLIASMISSANFLMTYRYLSTLNNRKMRDARSFFSESVIVASWMMIAANPMLILGLFMLLSDRHWKTCFFDYSGGGDTILFQHMFWFFGHPEVYIIIIPCFGITNTLLSFYLRKRISARASLLYSLYTIAFLGFFVWGHHMYMVGLSHTTRMLYSTLTVMISVPAATKIMHWLVTFVNSAVHFELPLILTLLFVFYFVSGGISGMSVAHTGMDVLFHDTFYVIGHFHVMLAGSLMFAGFAAFYFYLPSIFGVKYSRFFSYLHIFYYSIGQIFTVIPMIWLGYLGMPRRVLDYPSAMGGWHSLISSAHIITVSGILAFVIMLFDSLRKQKSYTIKTFGVGRYNTRLNFYFYQLARNRYWISKHFMFLPVRSVWHSKSKTQVHNLEYLESTLFYYSFKDRTFANEWTYL